MHKWTEQIVLRKSTNISQIFEEIFNTLNDKGNANQNYTLISYHTSQNDNHQGNKQNK
jgi:hypothetical protein